VPDPPSLVDLRNRVEAMLPRIDLGELILEVMAWYPGFADAFTVLSGSATRLDDLHVTIAATLTAHAYYRDHPHPGLASGVGIPVGQVPQCDGGR
jgi:hypothetical protein